MSTGTGGTHDPLHYIREMLADIKAEVARLGVELKQRIDQHERDEDVRYGRLSDRVTFLERLAERGKGMWLVAAVICTAVGGWAVTKADQAATIVADELMSQRESAIKVDNRLRTIEQKLRITPPR